MRFYAYTGSIKCEPPNRHLYNFTGSLYWNDAVLALSVKQILLRVLIEIFFTQGFVSNILQQQGFDASQHKMGIWHGDIHWAGIKIDAKCGVCI